MRPGPKPKPSTLEQVAARQQNLGPLVKPKWLMAGASKVWNEQAPLAKGVKSADSAAFADYCICVYRLRTAERQLEREGLILDGANGPHKNPLCQLVREYRLSVQRWSGEFGLTPASGTKIEIYGERGSGPQKSKQPTKPNLLSGQFEMEETMQ